MKHRPAGIVIVTVIAALVFGAPAEASLFIDWDQIQFYGPPGSTFDNQPVGSTLTGLGVVREFGFDFGYPLDPGDSTREYTIHMFGMVSLGTVTSGPPGAQTYTTVYNGGTFEIYEDLTPDHDYGVDPPNATAPSTFADGTLLLRTYPDQFFVRTSDFSPLQVGTASYMPAFDRIGVLGSDLSLCRGWFTGDLTWRADVLLQGYLFRHDGRLEMDCTDPVEPSSWGRVKAAYR